MNFTNEEKDFLKNIIKAHLDEIHNNESIINQKIESFAAEIKAEEILNSILKKIN